MPDFLFASKDDVTNDARNNLIFEYTRLIRETRPLFILMENVPGLANGRGKQIFAQALAELEPSYHVLYDVLNCADYGVPKHEKDLFFTEYVMMFINYLYRINQILKLVCHQRLIQMIHSKTLIFYHG